MGGYSGMLSGTEFYDETVSIIKFEAATMRLVKEWPALISHNHHMTEKMSPKDQKREDCEM